MPVLYYYVFLRFGIIFRLSKVPAVTPVVDIQRVGISAAQDIKSILKAIAIQCFRQYHLLPKAILDRVLSVELSIFNSTLNTLYLPEQNYVLVEFVSLDFASNFLLLLLLAAQSYTKTSDCQ